MSDGDELLAYARLLAIDLRRRWPALEIDDIASEIVLYVLATPQVAAEWTDYLEGDYVDQDAERHASNRMRLIARRAGERYCRRELAERIGYRPEDEAYYSVGALRVLVEHYYTAGLTERADLGRADSVVRVAGDPSARGGWLTSLLDVERGLGMLPARHRNRLKFRHVDMGAHSVKEIAAMAANLATAKGKRHRIERHLGTAESTIRSRIKRSLIMLQIRLGGAAPREELGAMR